MAGAFFVYNRETGRGNENLLIELKNISFVYSPGAPFEKRVFQDFNLAVSSGEVLLVTGDNGSGKTTLLQIIALVLKPTSGRILFDGEDAWKNPRRWRKKIGFSFQFPENQFFNLTVYDEITYASKNFGSTNLEKAYVNSMKLVKLDADYYRERIPYSLSGGEKRKIGIASIIAHDPEILVLDEPLVSLDFPSRKEIISFLEKWKAAGKAAVIATHKKEIFSHIADKVLSL